MKRGGDARLEKLLAESAELVEELKSLGLDAPGRAAPEFREEPPALEGYVEITVAQDAMRAWASFYPPDEGMDPIVPAAVERELDRTAVVHGVDWDTIGSALVQCNTEHQEILRLEVAAGRPAVPEVPAHFHKNPDVFEAAPQEESEDREPVDYREVQSFLLVHTGDVVALQVPPQRGVPGINVRGQEIPFPREPVVSLTAGAGVSVEGDRMVAAIDGTVEIHDGEVVVNEVLTLDGDVDYSTGHIDFPGDVILRGAVRDGFRIRSGSSVFCEQTVDVSDIHAEGNVVVRRGLIGRRKARLHAGGVVQAKFIENCTVEALEGLRISSAIMSSQVFTLGTVDLGTRGIIVGGRIFAQNGVRVTQLGTETSVKAEIILGVDFQASQKLEWVRDQTMRIGRKLNEVRQALQRAAGAQQEQLAVLEQKLREALTQMNNQAMELVMGLDRNEDARLEVRGTVHPGTYVEICHVSHVVGRPLRRVQFRLDKSEGRVVAEPL